MLWIDSKDFMDMRLQWSICFAGLGTARPLCYNDEVAYILSGICKGKSVVPDQFLIGIDNLLSTPADVDITSSRSHGGIRAGKAVAENIVAMIESCFDGNQILV